MMNVKNPIRSLFLLIFIQFLGAFIFFKGFFLIREKISDLYGIAEGNYLNETSWFNKTQTKKIIFTIIDGFRLDFAYFNETYEQETGKMNYYINKFPLLQNLTKKEPENTLFFKSFVDPPTVTFQRINSLMTGNIGSFIDFKNNFIGIEVDEDSLLLQLNSSGKKTVFIGPEAWTWMFPKVFYKAFGFDSFNSMDLHFVDNGIIKHLFPSLEENDWTLLIAHFLGVDHVGHTYEINHPEMESKLNQMNDVLQKVIDKLDNDTLFILIGDHGITPEGNHGGSSEDEITTMTFAYSKRGFTKLRNNPNYQEIFSAFNEKRPEKSIRQLDLTSTLAMLLNLPIPLINLGSILPDFYLEGEENKTDKERLFQMAKDLIQNLVQIQRYIDLIQSRFNKFPIEEINNFKFYVEGILGAFRSLQEKQYSNTDEKEIFNIILRIKNIARQIYTLCFRLWNDFNFLLMVLGLIILLIGFFNVLFFTMVVDLHLDTNLKYATRQLGDQTESNKPTQNLLRHFFKRPKYLLASGILIIISSTCFYMDLGINAFLGLAGVELSVFVFVETTKEIIKIIYFENVKPDEDTKGVKISILKDSGHVILYYYASVMSSYFYFSLWNIRNTEISYFCILVEVGLIYIYKSLKRSELSLHLRWKNVGLIVLFCSLLYLENYFDINTNRKYVKPLMFALPSLKNLASNNIVRFFLPAGLLSYGLLKLIRKLNKDAPMSVPKLTRIIICNYVLTLFFFTMREFYPDIERSNLFHKTIPQISYILAAIVIAVSYFKINELNFNGKLVLMSLGFVNPFCILIGKQAFILLLMHASIIYLFFKINSALGLSIENRCTGLLAILAIYFWYMHGYRPQIASAQVSNAFFGVSGSNKAIVFILLLINAGAPFILISLIFPIFWDSKENILKFRADQRPIEVRSPQAILRKRLDLLKNYLDIYFNLSINIAMNCLASAIYCRHLLLIEDFYPKFLFELLIFSFFTFVSSAVYTCRSYSLSL